VKVRAAPEIAPEAVVKMAEQQDRAVWVVRKIVRNLRSRERRAAKHVRPRQRYKAGHCCVSANVLLPRPFPALMHMVRTLHHISAS
jgi:hypothetical protein